jgi:hypothetical protein
MTEAPKPTRTEPGEIAWYWGTSDDGDSPIYGRYATKAEAIDAWLADFGDDLRYDLEQEGEIPTPISDDTLREMCPLVARYRKPSISCEIFDADHILEEMEDRNEVAASPDFPADPKPEIKRALERHMAEALFQFCEAHNLWDEFRGLEWMGDTDDHT